MGSHSYLAAEQSEFEVGLAPHLVERIASPEEEDFEHVLQLDELLAWRPSEEHPLRHIVLQGTLRGTVLATRARLTLRQLSTEALAPLPQELWPLGHEPLFRSHLPRRERTTLFPSSRESPHFSGKQRATLIMNSNQATANTFRLILALELLFTIAGIPQSVQMLGLDTWSYTSIAFVPMSVRLLFYHLVLQHHVAPSERTQAAAARGENVAPSALRHADALLQRAPQMVTLVTVTGYMCGYALELVMYRAFFAEPSLPREEWAVMGTMGMAAVPAATAVVLPLVSWTTAKTAAANHVLARDLGTDLERAHTKIASRISIICVCLVAAPILQGMASNIARADRVALADAAQEGQTKLAQLSLATSAPGGTAAFVQANENKRIVYVEGRAGQGLNFFDAQAPGFADKKFFSRLTAGDSKGVVNDWSAAAVNQDGVLRAVLVRSAGIDQGFISGMFVDMSSMILLGFIAAWLFSRSVSLPLTSAAESAQRAAHQGDLSQMGALPVYQSDEVGRAVMGLEEVITSMRSVATAAGAVGEGNLQVELKGRGELPDAFRGMLTQLNQVVSEMGSTSQELAAASMEILAATQEQEAASTSHSTGMREITQTMASLSESATHVADSVQAVLGNAERAYQNTERMGTRIDELTTHANRIGDILDVIREIADRTDLLALNGSLEASRAGEAGVGFSLVASEMRRLAERVTASTADIKSLVGDIRESGAATVVATEESQKLADATTQAARGIALVTQQQQSSTDQVSQHVRSVAETVQQAATATTQTRASADGLRQHSERLAEVLARFRDAS